MKVSYGKISSHATLFFFDFALHRLHLRVDTMDFPENLIIIEQRALIGNALKVLIDHEEIFPNVVHLCDPEDIPALMIEGNRTIFLVCGSSYPGIIRTIRIIRDIYPAAIRVVLDERNRNGLVFIFKEHTIHGYWTYYDSISGLVSGLIYASLGVKSVSPRATQHIEHTPKGLKISPQLKEHPLNHLSPREKELLMLIGEGKTTQHCSDEMNLTTKSTWNLHERLKKKIGVNSSYELLLKAIEYGLGIPTLH